MKHITIANRKNKTFEVKGNKSLLQELRSQGGDLPYGCNMEDALHVQQNLLMEK